MTPNARTTPWLKLRQVCLVSASMDEVQTLMHALFGWEVSVRDPVLAKHGLRNVVMPVGTNFIEIVTPIRDVTAAGRQMQRLGGDGGYMVILNCRDVPAWRTRLDARGVRIVHHPVHGEYQGIHLHPADTGAAIVELNRHGEVEEALGPYHPAGVGWTDFVRDEIVRGYDAIEIAAANPQEVSRRWAEVLEQNVEGLPDGAACIALNEGQLRFVQRNDDGPDRIAGIDLRVADRTEIERRARRSGVDCRDGALSLCGVTWRLREAS